MTSQSHKSQNVAVIGGGLGGLATAVGLASRGFDVDLFEKNSHLGGKLNTVTQDGFSFDLGPSILTLPHIFRETFQQAGRRMEDYVQLHPVRPHWRNFFEDGTTIDLDPDPETMDEELRKVDAGLEEPFHQFLAYSKSQYDLVAEGYFAHGIDTIPEFLTYYGLRIFKLSLFSTMDGAVRRRLPNPYLRDIFNFFIKDPSYFER